MLRSTLVLCALLFGFAAIAEDAKLLFDFEDATELKAWETCAGNAAQSDEHATVGKKSYKLSPDGYIRYAKPLDWSGYETLEVDVFVDGPGPIDVTLVVGDKDWDVKKTYWNRHNSNIKLQGGKGTLAIPVNGLYRGEAGSINNDLKYNVKTNEIVRFDLGFTCGDKAKAVYLDNGRLVKGAPLPKGLLAFDFGDASQAVFPGFTPITWNTVYGQEGRTAGLKKACPHANRARNDTFPTRLFQDFVWFGEYGNEFIVDVPNGKYHVWLTFCDCGYWGGEYARHHRRTITANGTLAWQEDRPEGGAETLFRFEHLEPTPGISVWDMYVKDLFKPATFSAEVTDGKLRIALEADAAWSCKVSAIVIYPESQKPTAEKWLADLMEKNKKEFESRAVYMGPHPKKLDIPADAQTQGWWLGYPDIDDQITFTDAPGKPQPHSRVAAKGQRVSFPFAVRPLKDFGEVKLSASDLTSSGGKIPASAVDLRYVHHLMKRGFNEISYTIQPIGLRRVDGSGLKLAKDLTRQFWVGVAIPPDAKGGKYSGTVTLKAGEMSVQVPISLEVLDIHVDEPEFDFGFFGIGVSGEFSTEKQESGLRESMKLLKSYGMNSFSGGPTLLFKGLKADGKPDIDYSEADKFFAACKDCGFTRSIYGYGAPALAGLHDGYIIGETGRNWEKTTGKSFKELLKIVWTDIQQHGQKNGWPLINWGMLDEPRVIEDARAHLELHQAYREAVPFVRTGGYYSVHWDNDPLHVAIQDIFKTMTWSGLNLWTPTDLEKAKEHGREIHIYNQGYSRYSFGAYQFAAMRQGVKGRMQWMYHCVYGYQFFDLDAREPDGSTVYFGRNEIIPNLVLPRAGEGAVDFRIATTLWNLAERKKDLPEAKAAQDFLNGIVTQIGQQRMPPKDYMGDEAFRARCIEHLRKLMK